MWLDGWHFIGLAVETNLYIHMQFKQHRHPHLLMLSVFCAGDFSKTSNLNPELGAPILLILWQWENHYVSFSLFLSLKHHFGCCNCKSPQCYNFSATHETTWICEASLAADVFSASLTQQVLGWAKAVVSNKNGLWPKIWLERCLICWLCFFCNSNGCF